MVNHSKSKVLGAFAVGAILVGGSYLAANAKPSPELNSAALSVTTVESPLRVPIPVVDSNKDGIEDWQEVFVSEAPLLSGSSSESYVFPETITGQIGVNFFQEILSAKAYEGIGRSREEIIADTAAKITAHAADEIYTVSDLTLSQDSSAEAIKKYANQHAETIVNNNVPGRREELVVLREVLDGKTEPGLQELELISQIYLNIRDQALLIPVPNILAKEHLDLINVYNGLYHDISAMTKVTIDPMLTFVRMKRYLEDIAALELALKNLYLALKPYAGTFDLNDKALLFNEFNPDLR